LGQPSLIPQRQRHGRLMHARRLCDVRHGVSRSHVLIDKINAAVSNSSSAYFDGNRCPPPTPQPGASPLAKFPWRVPPTSSSVAPAPPVSPPPSPPPAAARAPRSSKPTGASAA